MKISKVSVNKFRKFDNVDITMGEVLTCLSGQNGVGKSTLLGILGNLGELNKSIGAQVSGEPFRADWADIIKGEEPYDVKGSKLYSIFFNEVPDTSKLNPKIYEHNFVDVLNFRATWQANSRYRLLPMVQKERDTNAKLEWPTLYLGLGRLYPVGESKQVNIHDSNLSTEERKYLSENHKSILSSIDVYNDISDITISETSKKKSTGIITDNYGVLANSAGQDNLSQILIGLLSFKRLKKSLGSDYLGGIFLIDEIDATLHPAAQNHLIDFLFREANKLGIQIIFTTHSLTLLEHISKFQQKSTKNACMVVTQYFSTGRGKLEIKMNPSLTFIRNDLMISYSRKQISAPVPVYTEDEVGRWLFENIIKIADIKNLNCKLLSLHIGYNELLKLVKEDYEYFNNNVITILDSDVTPSKIREQLKGSFYNYDEKDASPKESILVLPGNSHTYIEKEFWEFIYKLEENHGLYFEPELEMQAFFKQTLLDGAPSKRYTRGTIKDKTKAWFQDNLDICTIAFPYWYKENEQICKHFVQRFVSVYNNIALSSGRPLATK